MLINCGVFDMYDKEIDVWDLDLPMYKEIANAGFATIEHQAAFEDIEPEYFGLNWKEADHVWRLNGQDELVLALDTIRLSVEYTLHPFTSIRPGAPCELLKYKKITLLAHGFLDHESPEIFCFERVCQFYGVKLVINRIDSPSNYTFAANADFIVHVKDFDNCGCKDDAIYDFIKHLELA